MNAREILKEQVFKDAVEDVRSKLFSLWENSNTSDQEGREECYREIHALKAVINKLQSQVDDEKLKEINNG